MKPDHDTPGPGHMPRALRAAWLHAIETDDCQSADFDREVEQPTRKWLGSLDPEDAIWLVGSCLRANLSEFVEAADDVHEILQTAMRFPHLDADDLRRLRVWLEDTPFESPVTIRSAVESIAQAALNATEGESVGGVLGTALTLFSMAIRRNQWAGNCPQKMRDWEAYIARRDAFIASDQSGPPPEAPEIDWNECYRGTREARRRMLGLLLD